MYIVVKMRDCEVEANEAELAEKCVAGPGGSATAPELGSVAAFRCKQKDSMACDWCETWHPTSRNYAGLSISSISGMVS